MYQHSKYSPELIFLSNLMIFFHRKLETRSAIPNHRLDDADDERRGNDDQKRCTSSASPACSPQDDGDVSPDQYRLKTAFSCFFRGICAADSALAAHPAILSSWWRLPAIKVPQRPSNATPAARLAPCLPAVGHPVSQT